MAKIMRSIHSRNWTMGYPAPARGSRPGPAPTEFAPPKRGDAAFVMRTSEGLADKSKSVPPAGARTINEAADDWKNAGK